MFPMLADFNAGQTVQCRHGQNYPHCKTCHQHFDGSPRSGTHELNVVYEIDDGDRVSCYFCKEEQNRGAPFNDFGRGEAFLAGPGHSPLDGNANYICRDHLDPDAIIV